MSVSIHHQVSKGTPQNYIQNCPEIIECLKNQDFDLFIKHLEVRKYIFIYGNPCVIVCLLKYNLNKGFNHLMYTTDMNSQI